MFQRVTQDQFNVVTCPTQLVTRFDLSEYDVKIMFSIIFWTKFELILFNTFTLKLYYNYELGQHFLDV